MTDEQRNSIRLLQEQAMHNGIVQSCINCESWLKAEDKCIRYDVKPPATVIYYGCEKWEYNIPF